MPELELNHSYFDSANSRAYPHLIAELSLGGETQEPKNEETTGSSEGTHKLGIDSLHTIAGQLAAGDTLDEVLARALGVIAALVHCESFVAYVLQSEKFHPWIWKTGKSVSESELSLDEDLKKSLTEQGIPIAVSHGDENRRITRFDRWSRDPGETSIAVPLLSRNKLVGAISFQHAPHRYSEPEFKLLSTIGFLIGADIGISLAEAENAELREDLEARKVIERGKGVLQRDLRVSSQQAYLILEHLSHHKRKSIKDIAEAIILADRVMREAAAGPIPPEQFGRK